MVVGSDKYSHILGIEIILFIDVQIYFTRELMRICAKKCSFQRDGKPCFAAMISEFSSHTILTLLLLLTKK